MFVRTIVTIACCAAGAAALALPAPNDAAAAGASKRGVAYKGKTAQKRAIAFRLSHGKLDLRHFSVRLRCRDGSMLIDKESGFKPSPLRGGRFRDDQVGSTDEVWLRGRVRGRVIRGKLRVKDRWGHVRCNSHWVKFTAKQRGH